MSLQLHEWDIHIVCRGADDASGVRHALQRRPVTEQPEEELIDGADRISDPEGHGLSIWFHVVPDAKAVKNRLHLDIHASGERTDPIETRRKRVDAEASRLAGLGATITGPLSEEGLDHYAVGMKDPEGNEFDIN
jgi:Glyoxalase-like domain